MPEASASPKPTVSTRLSRPAAPTAPLPPPLDLLGLRLNIGTIDNHLNFNVSADGMVSLGDGSTAKDYPSLEVYSYNLNSDGKIVDHLLVDKKEASDNDTNADLKKGEKRVLPKRQGTSD